MLSAMLYHSESREVLYSKENFVSIGGEDLEELKQMALGNPRQRIRLCAHRSKEDRLHEMFIIHTRNCYVRPHKHIGKPESMAVLEGEADAIIFDDHGGILKVIRLGDRSSDREFFYRIEDPLFHTLRIRSNFFVFHEVTEGPFDPRKTLFPEWAPAEGDSEIASYLERLDSLIYSDLS